MEEIRDEMAKDCKVGGPNPSQEIWAKSEVTGVMSWGIQSIIDYLQLKDWTNAIVVVVHGNNTEKYDEVLMMSDEVSMFSFQ